MLIIALAYSLILAEPADTAQCYRAKGQFFFASAAHEANCIRATGHGGYQCLMTTHYYNKSKKEVKKHCNMAAFM